MIYKYSLSLAVSLALLSAAAEAQAQTVRVDISGRTAQQARADIKEAARSVCTQAIAQDRKNEYGNMSECVAATVTAAISTVTDHPTDIALAKQSSQQP